MFRARLFGIPRLEWDGVPVPPVSGLRARSILFQLLYSFDQQIPRSLLAGLHWPESTEQQARTNLRREVHLLRQHHSVFDRCIESTRHTLRWRMPRQYDLDIERFRVTREIFNSDQCVDVRLAAGMQAVSYCNDEFLRGHDDAWITENRRVLEVEWVTLAEDLLVLLNRLQRYESVIAVARQILARMPLHESIYLNLLIAYKSTGNTALAMHTYHQCESMLKSEYNVAPNSTLLNLYASLTETGSGTTRMDTATTLPIDLGNTRFFGRQGELEIFAQAIATPGTRCRLFAISGEPGIGKTRLAEEAMRLAVSRGLPVTRAYCHANASDLAFWPLRQWLQTPWLKERFAMMEEPWQDEIAFLFPELKNQRSSSHRHAPKSRKDRNISRRKLFEAFTRLLTATDTDELHRAEPAVLFVDDLQWCDQDSLEYLQYLFNQENGCPLIVLVTIREASCAPDHALSALQRQLSVTRQSIEIALDALGLRDSLSLATDLMTQLPIARTRSADLETICRWSRGNPFYLVESLRHIVSVDENCLHTVREHFPVAPRITAIILDRIYRLEPSTRQLVYLAAVVGRSFSIALLEKLYPARKDSLIEQLDVLWRKRIICDVANGEYDFSHACIREACYESLATPSLCAMHAKVAQALEELHASDTDPVASQIAMHWDKARQTEHAFNWYCKALAFARNNLICRDALQYVNACLRLMDGIALFEGSASKRVELMLNKSHMLSLIDGFGNPEEGVLCEEIRVILPEIVDEQLLFSALGRLRLHASFSGEMQKALEYCHQQMIIANRCDSPALKMEAFRSLTFVQFSLGHYGDMLNTAQRGVGVIRKAESSGCMNPRSPQWSVSMLKAMNAYALYMAGRFNEADKAFNECSNYENSQGDTHVVALVHLWIAMFHLLRHDVIATNRLGLSLIRFGEKSRLEKIHCMGLYFCSWSKIQNGDSESGMCQMREAIERMETTEEYMSVLEWRYELAQACIDKADFDGAARVLDKTRCMEIKSGVRYCESTGYRLQAELLAGMRSNPKSVLRHFAKSRSIAASHNAVILLLRCLVKECRYRESVNLQDQQISDELAQLVEKFRRLGNSPELQEADLLVDARTKDTIDS
ncbi:MAG: AAA family ATPase [Granulosicoccus sp.]|nr:AAA family ATPase [Granulosicoccus sp.]